MAKLRAMRKKGGSIWGYIAHGLIHTALPIATGVIGDAVGGPVGGVAGSMVGNIASDAIGKATGYGLTKKHNHKHKLPTPYNPLVGGVDYPIHGGSFLQMGG